MYTYPLRSICLPRRCKKRKRISRYFKHWTKCQFN